MFRKQIKPLPRIVKLRGQFPAQSPVLGDKSSAFSRNFPTCNLSGLHLAIDLSQNPLQCGGAVSLPRIGRSFEQGSIGNHQRPPFADPA